MELGRNLVTESAGRGGNRRDWGAVLLREEAGSGWSDTAGQRGTQMASELNESAFEMMMDFRMANRCRCSASILLLIIRYLMWLRVCLDNADLVAGQKDRYKGLMAT